MKKATTSLCNLYWAKRLMKITDFFQSSKPFSNKGKESPVCTTAINNAEQQEEGMALPGLSATFKIQTPKKKRERFSDAENQKLVDAILAHMEKLFGPKQVNASGRAAIWDKVVKEVNKIGGMRRTVQECKKRWHDYKRKIKQVIENLKEQSWMGGPTVPLSDVLTKRQLKVAQFFKLDTNDAPRNEMHHESSSDIGECVSSNDFTLSSSFIIESDDEIMPSQNKPLLPMTCLPSTSHQDKFISQSHEEPQAAKEPRDPPHNTKAADKPIPPYTATESQLLLETQMDQLAAQQKDMMEALKSIQKSATESLNVQNKMYNLVKVSFLELQKTLLSGQKTSRDRSGILELSLNSLHAKLDEMNSALRVQQLQEMMSSDESELSDTQEIRYTPTAAYTPAATSTPTNTQARKRPSDQSASPMDSMKKKKISK
ncbi:uncharacterized protein [Dendrobates tinctorius]|uniref:uncharacterized protein isoform X3 n=2 Tax=Dendrobates tinctorius TaxID=92724 RepID=UPI003CCA57FD